MSDELTRWDKYGAMWNALFMGVDEGLAQFAGSADAPRDLKIAKYRWEAPDRLLSFLSPAAPQTSNNIHLLLSDDGAVRVSSAAWIDEPSNGQVIRRWCHSTPGLEAEWSFRPDEQPGRVAEQTLEAVRTAYRIVSQWKFADGGWVGTGLMAEEPAPIPL